MIMCQGQIPPTVVLPNFTPRFGGGFFIRQKDRIPNTLLHDPSRLLAC